MTTNNTNSGNMGTQLKLHIYNVASMPSYR